MNSFVAFIVKDLLGQASILIAFIAMLGLILQKKSPGKTAEGTFKTLLGFLIMMAGINIIVATLTFLNDIFTQGFGMKGYITDVAAIAGLANRELGSEVALTLLVIFAVNIIIARLTPLKYIFLTGQALLWMATIGAVIGYKSGLTGVPLILTGGIFGGVMAVLMPALAQPVVRRITGSDDVALGHFCTIGYLVQAAVAKVVGKGSRSTEDLELPDNFKFLQDTYLAMAVVMVPMYLIPAIAAGPQYIAQFSGGINYLMYAFMQSIQFVAGVFVLYSGVRLLLNELVPAFRGIAMRIVPDAKPALDCPVLFPYAPNAVIVGFLATTVGSIIGMLDVRPGDDSPRAVNQLFRRRYGRGIWQCAGRTSRGDDRRGDSRPVYHISAGHSGTHAGELRLYGRHLQRFRRHQLRSGIRPRLPE
jgi:PTS system ascorbate-specific IIC component